MSMQRLDCTLVLIFHEIPPPTAATPHKVTRRGGPAVAHLLLVRLGRMDESHYLAVRIGLVLLAIIGGVVAAIRRRSETRLYMFSALVVAGAFWHRLKGVLAFITGLIGLHLQRFSFGSSAVYLHLTTSIKLCRKGPFTRSPTII